MTVGAALTGIERLPFQFPPWDVRAPPVGRAQRKLSELSRAGRFPWPRSFPRLPFLLAFALGRRHTESAPPRLRFGLAGGWLADCMLPTRLTVILFAVSLALLPLGVVSAPFRWLVLGYEG